jgi:CBS domain-containing protein
MKEKVEEIMTRKVVTVKETDSLQDVATIFKANRISGAPVLNDKEEVVGVVSEADILKVLDTFHWYTPVLTTLDILHLREEQSHDIQQDIEKASEMKMEEIMSTNPETISPDTSIDDAAQIMHATGFNRLPVVDGDGKLVGIVTRADIIASLYEPEP